MTLLVAGITVPMRMSTPSRVTPARMRSTYRMSLPLNTPRLARFADLADERSQHGAGEHAHVAVADRPKAEVQDFQRQAETLVFHPLDVAEVDQRVEHAMRRSGV